MQIDDRHVAFTICAPFSTCKTEINDFYEANHIYIAMSIYDFIEYNDNYSDAVGSL